MTSRDDLVTCPECGNITDSNEGKCTFCGWDLGTPVAEEDYGDDDE